MNHINTLIEIIAIKCHNKKINSKGKYNQFTVESMKRSPYKLRPNIEFDLVNELLSEDRGIAVEILKQPLMCTLIRVFPDDS